MDLFEALNLRNLTDINRSIKASENTLSSLNNEGHTALHVAIEKHLFLPTKTLIESGAPLDAQTTVSKNTPLLLALHIRNTAASELLIAAGANLDIQNSDGDTALMCAVRKGLLTTVQQLLDAGANPDIQNNSGQTAVLLSVSLGNSPDITKLLLEKGANPDIQKADGSTAFHHAVVVDNLTVVQALIDANANPNIMQSAGKTPVMIDTTRTIRDMLLAYQKKWVPSTRTKIIPAIKKGNPVSADTATSKNLAMLDKIIGRTKPETPATPVKDVIPKWKFLPPVMIAQITVLESANYKLTEFFNFETRQYITAMQNLQTGFETGNQRDFDEIRDKTVLGKALEAFTQAGGKADPHVIDTGFRNRKKEPLTPPSLTPPSPGTGG